MKKRLSYILIIVACFTLGSCKRDNYEGPNATISGTIKDIVTKEPVGTDLVNGSTIRAFELGFATPTAQTWIIKPTGEFQNKMIFAAKYDMEFINGNFYPFTEKNVEIKGGNNLKDFEVTPYIRIKEASITHNAAENKIVATFKLEGGKPEVKVSAVRLYGFTDIYVGEQVKFATAGNTSPANTYSRTFTGAQQTIDGSVYTLTIDLAQNQNFFGIHRNYYFRIGALSIVPNVGTVRHNYSPLVKIAL